MNTISRCCGTGGRATCRRARPGVRLLTRLLLAACCVLIVLPGTSPRAEPGFSTSPSTNSGKRWRVAYYEGGAHGNYTEYLRAVVGGLMKLGWMEPRDIPETPDNSARALWAWLSGLDGKYLEFKQDAFYSAGWDQGVRDRQRQEFLGRLNTVKDIDLVLALGTWAGKDLAVNDHEIPTIVMSTSEPVRSGIIEGIHDSGRDHVHARVDPKRYERQVRVFHEVIEFGRLGVAYEDSPDGRSYAAMDTVEKVARERGFELVRCYTQSDVADQEAANRSVVECFEQLVKETDAIYVSNQGGVNQETIPNLVDIANRHRVPTFSQAGSQEVRHGFLMSISRPSYKPVGRFLAATVAKVLNGAQPRELNQLFEESPSIAINLKTAEVIGLYLYADVLAAADEIYRDIVPPAR